MSDNKAGIWIKKQILVFCFCTHKRRKSYEKKVRDSSIVIYFNMDMRWLQIQNRRFRKYGNHHKIAGGIWNIITDICIRWWQMRSLYRVARRSIWICTGYLWTEQQGSLSADWLCQLECRILTIIFIISMMPQFTGVICIIFILMEAERRRGTIM